MIALYIRLSLEDEEYDSMSIENQRLILNEYAHAMPEAENAAIQEFVDNGFTGTNFERPAMQRLLELVRQDQVDCIIVKDFSRFGRNSLEVGYFIERVFPLFHTRFISISDDYDSKRFKGDTGGMDVAFKYLINEYYSRDMSIKTRSAKYAKMERGEYQSIICPYGYRKSADGRMEPDPETADNVRLIFDLCASGQSTTEIIAELRKRQILTPGEYKTLRGTHKYDISRSQGLWIESTILRILGDERYTGTYVVGKRAVIEVGSTRTHKKDREQWYVIPDHHPAIVSKELFNAAAKKIRRFQIRKRASNSTLALKGKVFCECCKHALPRLNQTTYACRFSDGDKTLACHKLRVPIAEVENTVFQSIQKMGELLALQPEQISGLDGDGAKFSVHEAKMERLKDEKMFLYERYLSGELTLDDYYAEKSRVDEMLLRTKSAFEAAQTMAKKQEIDFQRHIQKKTVVEEIEAANSLTTALADRLIERVFVAPDKQIRIVFKMNDIFNGVTVDFPYAAQSNGN